MNIRSRMHVLLEALSKRHIDDEAYEFFGSFGPDEPVGKGVTPRRFKKMMRRADAAEPILYSKDQARDLAGFGGYENTGLGLKHVIDAESQRGRFAAMRILVKRNRSRNAETDARTRQDLHPILHGIKTNINAMPRATTVTAPNLGVDHLVGGRTRSSVAAALGQSFPTNRLVNRYERGGDRFDRWVDAGGRERRIQQLGDMVRARQDRVEGPVRNKRLRDDPLDHQYLPAIVP